MKIEEIERLAVAATAEFMAHHPWREPVLATDRIREWRSLYSQVLAEFIEQEKAEQAKLKAKYGIE